jgi:hypothetical protein
MDNVPLTTGAWITLRVTHNSTSPNSKEGILFLAGMKGNNREFHTLGSDVAVLPEALAIRSDAKETPLT